MKAKLISFVIAEAPQNPGRGEVVQAQGAKSAPHYFESSVPSQFILSQERIALFGKEVSLAIKTYPPSVLVAEIQVEVNDIFFEEMFDLKEEALKKCREVLLERGAKDVEQFSEEYSLFVVTDFKKDPEQFFLKKEKIAGLLKSEKIPLDDPEVEYTLSSQLKYGKNDLVIVDWDGAFAFDPDGDYEYTLELLELANFQLLRYRLLDKELDERFNHVVKLLESAPEKTKFFFKAGDISKALKNTMKARALSISEFQGLEREFNLIGDWYSARLYELVAKKFKLDEWRKTLKDKLDALEDVYAIASENFTISWERRGRIIELVGWYVLLFGWLVLLIMDIYFYKQ